MYLLGVAALVLNPFVACGSSSFSFGMADVEKALAGSWQASLRVGGESQTVKFRIEPASANQHSARTWIRAANACGARTLVKSAHACVDETTVPLKLIALESTTIALDSGELRIVGTSFRSGEISVMFGGSQYRLRARISSTGAVEQNTDDVSTLTHLN
jgi:hypothetical protein